MKKHCISIALVLISIANYAIGKDWVLTNAINGWNATDLVRLYFHNSDLQVQWAWQALSQYHFRGNEQVLDFGAGDGKLSALISTLVPEGKVVGVDISKEMIAFASKVFPACTYRNLNFIVAEDVDFGKEIICDRKFDLVTSFCVFHLIPNLVIVLTNIKEKMMPDAKLVLTFPIGGNPEFFKAASEEMATRGWVFPSPTQDSKQMRRSR
jgi:trans-aconitate 2-methyltransferase